MRCTPRDPMASSCGCEFIVRVIGPEGLGQGSVTKPSLESLLGIGCGCLSVRPSLPLLHEDVG